MSRLKHTPLSRAHKEICEKPAKSAKDKAIKEGRLFDAALHSFQETACKRMKRNLMRPY